MMFLQVLPVQNGRFVADRTGKPADVVSSCNEPASYEHSDTCFSAPVGRCANGIKKVRHAASNMRRADCFVMRL